MQHAKGDLQTQCIRHPKRTDTLFVQAKRNQCKASNEGEQPNNFEMSASNLHVIPMRKCCNYSMVTSSWIE
jgi:hypothetical protein